MTRKLLMLTLPAVAWLALGPAAYADPVALAPGASANFNFISPTEGSAFATFSLNAAGTQLTINFQNVSANRLRVIAFDVSPNANVTASAFSGTPAGADPRFARNFDATNFSGTLGKVYELSLTPNLAGVPFAQFTPFGSVPGQGGTLVLSFASPFTLGLTIDLAAAVILSRDQAFQQIIAGVPGAPIPEPATLLLLSTGLAGLAVRIRRRRPGVSTAGEGGEVRA